MNCALCHKEIPIDTPDGQIAKQLVVWKAPGSSKSYRPRETGSLAHVACLLAGVDRPEALWS